MIQQRLGLDKVAALHRDPRQDAMTQQHRQPILRRQLVKGRPTMQARRIGMAAQCLQGAVQRLPVHQQTLIAPGIRQRQKMPEPRQALGGFVQSPAEQQGLGAQIDQARAAVQQLRFDTLTPVHQLAQMTFAEDPAQPQALHVIGSHLRLISAQRLLHRLIDMPQHAEQLTGPQAQPIQRCCVQLVLQGLCHGGQQAIPTGLLLDREQKCPAVQQAVKYPTTLLAFP
ncbi:hypothetical protein D3C75_705150 [compost metagenome]